MVTDWSTSSYPKRPLGLVPYFRCRDMKSTRTNWKVVPCNWKPVTGRWTREPRGLRYCKRSARYGRWLVCNALKVKEASLNLIRHSMGSQCSSLRSLVDVSKGEWEDCCVTTLASAMLRCTQWHVWFLNKTKLYSHRVLPTPLYRVAELQQTAELDVNLSRLLLSPSARYASI